MTRWTEADYARHLKPLSAAQVKGTSNRAKYHNEKCTWQGLKFDSLHELEDYKNFKLQEIAGAIRAVVRQVSMPLAGSERRIRIDFMVVENSGGIRWYDSKGFETETFKLKQSLALTAYGIKIETI